MADSRDNPEIATLRAENERLKLVAEVAKEWATPENFYRLRHRRLLREALEALTPPQEPQADIQPCHWIGGNDGSFCTTCYLEHEHNKPRPACPKIEPQEPQG